MALNIDESIVLRTTQSVNNTSLCEYNDMQSLKDLSGSTLWTWCFGLHAEDVSGSFYVMKFEYSTDIMYVTAYK